MTVGMSIPPQISSLFSFPVEIFGSYTSVQLNCRPVSVHMSFHRTVIHRFTYIICDSQAIEIGRKKLQFYEGDKAK